MKIQCLHDHLIPISELKFHPKNRNHHPDDQIKRLAEILKYQGWRYPVKVSKRSGFVTSGHGRIEAARLNGWDQVPVNFQDYENDDQEYADLVADNSVALWAELDLSGINADLGDLGPDFDIDMLGLKDFVIEPVEKLEPQCDEDEVPAAPKEPKTKLGDIYQLGRHRLMCGDSINIQQVEALLDGSTVEMLHTDPPYGLGDRWTGGTWGANPMYADAKRWDQALEQSDVEWMLTLAPLCIVWGGNYYNMPASRCWLAWSKTQKMETMADFELAWTNFDKVAKEWDGARNADGKRQHPTQKPVELIEWAMSVHADPKSVLDLFGGSGSTLIACEKTNRRCFMMELDPHYCDVIVSRYLKYTGKKSVILNGEEITWDG